MFRFVHMADVHLDSPMQQKGKHRENLKTALEQAFYAAVDLAIGQRCHALIIAGDLFDGDDLSFNTEKLIHDSFLRLHNAGIGVFYCHGNHDPADARRRRITWPDNVIVFNDTTPQSHVVYDSMGQALVRIVGAGFPTRDVRDNLAARFPMAQGDLPTVGIMHAMVGQYSSEHEPYAACSIQDLERVGYDYWALGHIHQRMTWLGDRIVYPGNLSGRSIKEQGDKGVYLVQVERGLPARTQFVPLSKVCWTHTVMNNLDAYNDPMALYGALRYQLETLPRNRHHYVRLTLSGNCPLAHRLDEIIEDMERKLCNDTGVVVQIKNRTHLPLDIRKYKGEAHLLSSVLKLLENAKGNEEILKNLCETANIEGDGVDYTKTLLEGMDQMVVDAMLEEDYKHADR